jgi:SnoaL-like domain
MVERSVGTRFVEAVAAQDEPAIRACLAPGVVFRALVPPGLRERTGNEDAAALVAGWFADWTELDLVESRVDDVGDRLHLGYRIEGVEHGDPIIVEQHVYCEVADGVIEHADLLCSGPRPRHRD